MASVQIEVRDRRRADDGRAVGGQHQPVNGDGIVFIPLGTDGQIEGFTQ